MKLRAGDVAVITGGASGIGFAVAGALADRGLRLVLADVEPGALEAAADQLRASGAEVVDRVVDVRHLGQVQTLAEATVDQYGQVDLIFNNAGVVGRRALLWEQDEPDWRWVLEVNFCGVMNGIRSFVPHMVKAGRGHIVNTASIHGLGQAGGGHGTYSASKFAVVGLSEHLRFELDRVAPEVGVTILCPGAVETRIGDAGRNRPREYAASGASSNAEWGAFDRGLMRVQVDDVVESILDGIEADLLYMPVAPQVIQFARERVAQVLEGLAAAEKLAPQWPG